MNDGSLLVTVRGRLAAFAPRLALNKERAARALIALLFVAIFLAHLPLLRPVMQNGDSAGYNSQIEQRDFTGRPTHIGYFALGVLFNTVLPFGTDLNMNVMLLTLGCLGLFAVYAAALHFSGSRWAACGSVLLALALPSEVRGMLLSEVDVASVSLVALAYALFLYGRSVIAGLVFGLSVLVTPLSGPMLVVFLLTVRAPGHGFRRTAIEHASALFKFGVASLLVYLPPMLTHYHDYLYSTRGIINAPHAHFAWPKRLTVSWQFVWHEARWLLPLYAGGVVACLSSARVWRAGQPALALLISFATMALAGQHFLDVPVQLPNLVLLAILPAVALSASRSALAVGSLLVLGIGYFTLQTSYSEARALIHLRDRERKICEGIRAHSGPYAPVLVGVVGSSAVRMYARSASGGRRPPLILEMRGFVAGQRHWIKAREYYQFWFFRHANRRDLEPLLKAYTLESQSLEGHAFQVLVPRHD